MSQPRVLVIVPAHDEAESLPTTLAELAQVVPWAAVVVVDDASEDDTATIARAAGVPVVRHATNLGVLGALLTGFRWGRERGYDIAVQFDADGQHDPRFLESVVAPVRDGTCDITIGSRYVVESGIVRPAPDGSACVCSPLSSAGPSGSGSRTPPRVSGRMVARSSILPA